MNVTPMRHPKVTSAIGKMNEARNLLREASRDLSEAKASSGSKEVDELADQVSTCAKRLW